MADLMTILADAAQRARLPAGMRNNNPGNIKYVGQKVPGIVGPSVNTDQGDPQAVFSSPEAGMAAMYSLLNKKYVGGKVTPDQIIAGQGGWTPGNHQAAANVARTMGIGPNDDIGFSDPARAASFMHGLILQEHGNAGNLYPESMIASAIGGGALPTSPAAQTASSPSMAATPAPRQSAMGRLFNPKSDPDKQMGFFGRLTTAPAQEGGNGVPAAVQAAAEGGNSQKSPLSNIFGALALTQAQQQPQFSPVQIRGPTAEQANALNNLLQSLRGRIV
ncbi:hypothetical protein PH562_16760 [Rhizobium sp. CNPSo 4062]|uniref:hypothetical protein n=1 Tax=Rhizobium sp. CNPSo 4062 TaxID=3021410 RepID=UPI00254B4B8D|nr:hypothetical protein [Rhizobium sp. CNPSo 4062]MDK4703904.1 hypothetical protein [Rhizobium sp. CNPSo 4062]